jgi:hypothetical protein
VAGSPAFEPAAPLCLKYDVQPSIVAAIMYHAHSLRTTHSDISKYFRELSFTALTGWISAASVVNGRMLAMAVFAVDGPSRFTLESYEIA